MDLKKLIEEQSNKEIAALQAMEEKLGKEAVRLQIELYELLRDKFIDSLAVDSKGNILFNSKNISRVNDLERTWQTFQEKNYQPVLIDFAKDLVSIVDLEAVYFTALGKEFDIAIEFGKITDLISKQIGINLETEAITEGSYLARLLEGSQVKDQIANLVLQNVSAKASFADLKKSMETLVKGDETTNGAMQKYLRTYAYDSFSNIQRAVDLNIADTYKFNYFIYQGDIIKDSREFCIEKVGGVYSRDDLAEWETEDWAGKNPDVPVEISLGGYNCRHTPMWIPDEAVDYFKGGAATNIDEAKELFKNNSLTDEEIEANRIYKSAGYWDMNGALRGEVQMTSDIEKYNQDLRNAIDDGIKFKGQLYRGTGLSNELYSTLMAQVKDGYYLDKGFNSFSMSENIAKAFVKTYEPNLVKFYLESKGINGAYLGNWAEQEVIFKDATRYIVNDVYKEIQMHGRNELEFTIIKMIEK